MTRSRTTLCLASAALALGCTAVQAQEKIAPGLWEHSFTMKSDSGRMAAAQKQMQAQMAALSPAQRKQMEAMLAQQGMAMDAQASTVKVCVSKEDAEQDRLPQGDGRCQPQSLQRSGNTVRFKFVCKGEPPTTDEGEYTLQGPKAYSGSSTIVATVQGKPERMDTRMTGRWLGADCGTLKPRAKP